MGSPRCHKNKFSASNARINIFKPSSGWALLQAGLFNATELWEVSSACLPARGQPGFAGHRLMGTWSLLLRGGSGRRGRRGRGSAERPGRCEVPAGPSTPRPQPARARHKPGAQGADPAPAGAAEPRSLRRSPPASLPIPLLRAGSPPFPQPAGTRPGTGCATPAAPDRSPISSRGQRRGQAGAAD